MSLFQRSVLRVDAFKGPVVGATHLGLKSKKMHHVRGGWRGQVKGRSLRSIETQRGGMEHVALWKCCVIAIARSSIKLVADNGVADARKVYTKLVLTTCHQMQLDQRESAVVRANSKVRKSGFACGVNDYMSITCREQWLTNAACWRWMTMHNREIDFLRDALGKLFGQCSRVHRGFGEYDDSAGLSVEAMYDAWVTGLVAVLSIMMAQAIEQILANVTTRGLHGQIARLVHRDEGFVFEEQMQWDGLVVEIHAVALWELNRDAVACAHAISLLDGLIIDSHRARGKQAQEIGARAPVEAPRQVAVDTLPRVLRWHIHNDAIDGFGEVSHGQGETRAGCAVRGACGKAGRCPSPSLRRSMRSSGRRSSL